MLSGSRMRDAHRKPVAGTPFPGGALRDGASLQARVGALEQRVRELEQALRDVQSAPAAAHGADGVSTEVPAAAPAGEPSVCTPPKRRGSPPPPRRCRAH